MTSRILYHALIRTHHITSRKKIAVLKASAKKLHCYVLLKSGNNPGVMFVEGSSQADVQCWVDVVHDLRYKDYHLTSKVSPSSVEVNPEMTDLGSLEELSTLKEMGAIMEKKGLLLWWRDRMGFSR